MLTLKRKQHGGPPRKSTSSSVSPNGRQAAAGLWQEDERSAASPAAPSRRRSRAVRPEVLVLGLALGSYAAMVALMWFDFARTRQGDFVMLIATLVFATFVIVPLILLRLARRDTAGAPTPLREYLERTTDTLTGPLGSRAALVQIMVVPALLMVCLVGISIALALAR
jgi:type IV secretory pathway VirB2 component (pilin)